MEAIVLAGGFGTRLRSVVADLPKPMAPVAGRPFLEVLLTLLARKGITRAVLALGYKAETIVEHFGASFQGIELAYAIEDKPLGTGGALRAALAKCRTESVLVANGDTYLDLDVGALFTNWRRDRRPQIVGREVDDTGRFGRLVVAGNLVRGFAAKGAGGPGVINLGHYLLPNSLFDGFELPEAFSFEADFLAQRIAELQFELTLAPGLFIDIGVPEDYRRAQTELAGAI